MRGCLLALCAIVGACGGGDDAGIAGDDHVAERMVFEGDELATLFGAGGEAAPIALHDGFRRVGLLWDAVDAGAIEVRTSVDGEAWTAWTAPEIVSTEDLAHAGHVDAIEVDDGGSGDDDPRAAWLQLRVPAGRAAPTFLVVEPLAEIPAASDPDVVAARAPRCAARPASTRAVTLHWIPTPADDRVAPEVRLRQHRASHVFTRGWCDLGYDHVVDRDGVVRRGRADAGDGGEIALLGEPTPAQACGTARLLRRLDAVGRGDVEVHRCAGDALDLRLDAILRQARNRCDAALR